MVFEELGRQDDEVLDWAKQHTEIFLPLDEAVQIEVRRILENHINFIDLKRQKSEADPFVVATAVVKGCTVVTEEKPSGGPDKKKIPDVCKTEGLTCIPVLEMLRREGLRLG